MRQKLLSLFILMNFLLITASHAQLTIGSGGIPKPGLLLQLKENDNLDFNASKGLGLPRVKLANLHPSTSIDLAKSIGGVGAWDLADHIGLFVYNVNENRCLIQPILNGLYVWEGAEWRYLGKEEEGPIEVYSFIDARDGEIYLARNFGSAAGDWMLENLRYNPLIHPDPSFTNFIETAASSLTPYTDKYFYYPIGAVYTPGGEPANWNLIKKNGLLYNWAAATNGGNNSTSNQAQADTLGTDPTPRNQGICPKGWHLPSDKEWNDLEKEIFENANKYSSYSSSLGVWQSAWSITSGYRPASGNDGQSMAMRSQCFPYNVSTGTSNGKSFSSSQGGFNVLSVGYASDNSVASYGSISYIWSASSVSTSQSWLRYISSSVGVRRGQYNRVMLNSVRCKKD